MQVKCVGVFCSADDKIPNKFKDSALELGAVLARNNYGLVTGGSKTGLMKQVIDGYSKQENGLHLHGVLPTILKIYNANHPKIVNDNLVWTETMHERLAEFHKRCDIAVVLPGGFGTLHELMDFLVHNQFGIINKQIILLNLDHFWDPLLDQFAIMVEAKALNKMHLAHLQIANSVNDCIEILAEQNPAQTQQGFDDHYWEADSTNLPDENIGYRINLENFENVDVTKVIQQNLKLSIEAQIGPYERNFFTISVKSDLNELIGGLKGDVLGKICNIIIFWIHEKYRGHGIGTKVINEVEAYAVTNQCKAIQVHTIEFQAIPFYEKLGFKTVAVFDDAFMGYKVYTMRKPVSGS